MVVGPGTVSDHVPIAPDPAEGAVPGKAIEGRSLGRIAWSRLKQDKVAIGGGLVVALLILVAIFAPLIVDLVGSPPNEFHQNLIDVNTLRPRAAPASARTTCSVWSRRTAGTSSAGSCTAPGSPC